MTVADLIRYLKGHDKTLPVYVECPETGRPAPVGGIALIVVNGPALMIEVAK